MHTIPGTGLARTRPEALRATPRWASDVKLLTSNDGFVPPPSGGQCGRVDRVDGVDVVGGSS